MGWTSKLKKAAKKTTSVASKVNNTVKKTNAIVHKATENKYVVQVASIDPRTKAALDAVNKTTAMNAKIISTGEKLNKGIKSNFGKGSVKTSFSKTVSSSSSNRSYNSKGSSSSGIFGLGFWIF